MPLPEPPRSISAPLLRRLTGWRHPASARRVLWLTIAAAIGLSGLPGVVLLWHLSGSDASLSLRLLAILLIGLSWGIPALLLWRAWRQYQRRQQAGVQKIAAILEEAHPDVYGPSEIDAVPEEFQRLATALNALESRVQARVHDIRHELRDARAEYAALRHLFDCANVMLLGLDRAGGLRLMNTAAQHLLGYTHAELQEGRWYDRLFPLPRCADAHALFSRLQDGESLPGSFETLMRAKSGTEYTIHWRCSEVFQTEADVTYSLVGLDVSAERRQARGWQQAVTHAQRLLQQAGIGVAALAPDGRFRSVNQAFCQFLNLPEDRLLSMRYQDIAQPDDAEQDAAAFQQVLHGHMPRYQIDRRYRCHDGAAAWGRLTASRSAQADEVGLSLTVWDMSAFKTTEDDLRRQAATLQQRIDEQQRQLARTHAELQEFVSIASHDLKTPLRGISRLAYWLSQEYAECIDERGQEMTNMLITRVRRLDRLIDGLLQYSRAGHPTTEPTAIDLRRFLGQVLLALPIPPHIEIAVAPDMPTIMVHPENIRQVFENLLNNAIQNMDKPAGAIRVTCQSRDGAWLFTVRDNGPGIDPKYHRKIFHLFETLEAKDLSIHTGIGLALVKKIVAGYGGDVWVESTPGKGSAFLFTLPRSTA